MTNSPHPDLSTNRGSAIRSFTASTITLGPGKAQTVGLGAYDASEPMPAFSLIYEPTLDEELMGISLERLDIPGKSKYIAVYHFHNFSDKDCRITVQLRK